MEDLKMSVLKKFKEKLLEFPEKEIIITKNYNYSFMDIECMSNFFAKKLLSFSHDDIVPFYLVHSEYVLPVILGILKAGKIPLPITNSLSLDKSIERINEIEFDTIICDKVFNLNLSVNIINVPEYSEYSKYTKIEKISENPISYIICTSGTTGIPKKVFLTGENICWLLEEFYNIVDFRKESYFLFTTPYTFDVSLTEIFCPIFTGGTLVCYESGVGSILGMEKILKENNISHLSLSPSFAETIVDTNGADVFESLQVLCLAGEIFPSSLANKLVPIISNGCRVFNLYGPSETTIYATYYELKNQEYSVVPIGKPLPGVEIKFPSCERIREGEQAELLIGGKGVSAGYLLQPSLDYEKFSIIDGERFYRTGDYVYFRGENLVFSSRADNQVQVNGIRVELDEVKSIVDQLYGISSSKVVFNNKKIYIFYISKITADQEIYNSLPKYISPIIVKVERYYFTQNRKLDVNKLLNEYYFKENIVAKDNIEQSVLNILSQFKVIDINDLDSLDLVRFFLEIEEVFNIEIEETSFYELKNINSICNYIKNNNISNVGLENIGLDDEEKYRLKVYLQIQHTTERGYKILPTPTQIRLYQNKQFRITYFDLKLKSLAIIEIEKIEQIIEEISNNIDIFRMAMQKMDNSLEFRVFECLSEPKVIKLKNLPSQSELQNILNSLDIIRIPIIIISTKFKVIRFYFPYHSIDASSINKLEKLINQKYNNRDIYIEQSSLIEYEGFKERMSKNDLSPSDLDILPSENSIINLSKLKRDMKIFKGSIKNYSSKEDIYLYTVYLICKCLLSDYHIDTIHGGMSYNFRNLENFDSESLIGDIHKKIPFKVGRFYSYQDFKNDFECILEMYSKGIDFNEIAFRRNDDLGKLIRRRLNYLSISINYIGEVMNINSIIRDIIENEFEKNFINIISRGEETYFVVTSDLFKHTKYEIDDENVCVVESENGFDIIK